MATTDNQAWAFSEAKRRAAAMDGAYSIYRHRINPDFMVRTVEAAPPHNARWVHVATIQPDGTYSFGPVTGWLVVQP
jgi:hypothetical protein